MKKSIIAFAVIILLASCGGGNAKLAGNVKDSSKKAPVENAIVKVGDLEAKTDRNGDFLLEGLPTGKASIFVIAEGYKPYEFGGYELRDGENKIEEIFIEKDLKVVKDPDSNKIIPPPPLPGTPVKTKPAFKEFKDFTNCVVLYSYGDPSSGSSAPQVFKYFGKILKIENNMPNKGGQNMQIPPMYVSEGKMYNSTGNNEWIAIDLPPFNKSTNLGSSPDSYARFLYSLIFRLLENKTAQVNIMDEINTDEGKARKYFLVSEDDKGNLFDGELVVLSEGKHKDHIIQFSGRLLVNGAGDRTGFVIRDIGKVPPISLPTNVKEMKIPPPPDMKPGQPPSNPPTKNP